MKRKLAVFDIDGTLFRSSLYTELVYEMIAAGIIKDPSFIEDIRAKKEAWVERRDSQAYPTYDQSVAAGVDTMLTSISVSDYENSVHRTIANNTSKVYSYTRNLIRTLKSQGYTIIAISGSPHELVEQFVVRYGFDIWVGQHWFRDGDKFTGEIIKTHTDKELIIKKIAEEYGLAFEDSYAIGDTAGDIGLLSIVDNPIAFNPTDELLEAAIENGWKVVVERKNIAYHLESGARSGQHRLSKYETI